MGMLIASSDLIATKLSNWENLNTSYHTKINNRTIDIFEILHYLRILAL